jgi:hypothetical protein
MAPPSASREPLFQRALPIYVGLLLAILTVVAVLLLFIPPLLGQLVAALVVGDGERAIFDALERAL